MIKRFLFERDKELALSKHFKLKEFSDERQGELFLDTNLIFYLECIFARCHASKIIITSGYRSPEEDKRVGGNGSGYHTKGQAVDFVVYDKHDKIIESKYICCIAQELGLRGIGLITNTATHIDTRKNGIWKGDERKSNNTVTSDFYNYFKLSLTDILNRVK